MVTRNVEHLARGVCRRGGLERGERPQWVTRPPDLESWHPTRCQKAARPRVTALLRALRCLRVNSQM